MWQVNALVHPVWVTGFTYSGVIFQRYVQNFERNLKNIVCIRVDNFAETVNFQTSWECSTIKNLKLSVQFFVWERKF